MDHCQQLACNITRESQTWDDAVAAAFSADSLASNRAVLSAISCCCSWDDVVDVSACLNHQSYLIQSQLHSLWYVHTSTCNRQWLLHSSSSWQRTATVAVLTSLVCTLNVLINCSQPGGSWIQHCCWTFHEPSCSQLWKTKKVQSPTIDDTPTQCLCRYSVW